MIRRLYEPIRRRLQEEVAGWIRYHRLMKDREEAQRREIRRMFAAIDTVPSPWWQHRRRWQRIRLCIELAFICALTAWLLLAFFVELKAPVKLGPRFNPRTTHTRSP